MISQTKFTFEALKQMEDVDIVFDPAIEKKQKSKKRRRVSVFCIRLLFCIMFSICLFCTITALGIMYTNRYHPWYQPPDPPEYVRIEDRINSVEFQISLNPKEDWTNRTMMLDAWIDSINNYSSLMHLTKEEGEEDVYYQYRLKNVCGSYQNPKARVRQFLYSNTTEIALKKDEDDNSCSQPYWPSEDVYSRSRSKCEEDAHPCFNKYSYATTVLFNKDQGTFKTCAKVKKVFPDAFPFMNDKNTKTKKKKEAYWWKYNWNGMVGNYTHYQTTFNVKYENVTSAMSGDMPIIEGEWSLRFYTESNLLWEPNVVHELQSLFYHLVQQWDVYEDHVQCANDFFDSNTGVLELEDQLIVNTTKWLQ